MSHTLAIAPVPSHHRADELLDAATHRALAEHIAAGRSRDAHQVATVLLTRYIPQPVGGVVADDQLDSAETVTPASTGARA